MRSPTLRGVLGRFALRGWTPDPRTVGLLVSVSQQSWRSKALAPANQVLATLLHQPTFEFTTGNPSIGDLGFQIPTPFRVQAGAVLVEAIAAAFAALGGAAMLLRAGWGSSLAAGALIVEALADVVSTIAFPRGKSILAQSTAAAWAFGLAVLRLVCLRSRPVRSA